MTDEQEKASKEIFHNVNESEGWLTIGQYSIFGWSVSGMESCIVIQSDKYPAKYIRDCIYHKLPPELRIKVTPATVAKTTVASSI